MIEILSYEQENIVLDKTSTKQHKTHVKAIFDAFEVLKGDFTLKELYALKGVLEEEIRLSEYKDWGID